MTRAVFSLDMGLGSEHYPRKVGRDALSSCSLKKRVSAFSELFLTIGLSSPGKEIVSQARDGVPPLPKFLCVSTLTLVLRNGVTIFTPFVRGAKQL